METVKKRTTYSVCGEANAKSFTAKENDHFLL